MNWTFLNTGRKSKVFLLCSRWRTLVGAFPQRRSIQDTYLTSNIIWKMPEIYTFHHYRRQTFKWKGHIIIIDKTLKEILIIKNKILWNIILCEQIEPFWIYRYLNINIYTLIVHVHQTTFLYYWSESFKYILPYIVDKD